MRPESVPVVSCATTRAAIEHAMNAKMMTLTFFTHTPRHVPIPVSSMSEAQRQPFLSLGAQALTAQHV
jgi:hypothetical protein